MYVSVAGGKVLLGGAFPKERKMTRDHWQDNGLPNDRVVDYFLDENANDKLAFACGYLPLYDAKKGGYKKYFIPQKTTRAIIAWN